MYPSSIVLLHQSIVSVPYLCSIFVLFTTKHSDIGSGYTLKTCQFKKRNVRRDGMKRKEIHEVWLRNDLIEHTHNLYFVAWCATLNSI